MWETLHLFSRYAKNRSVSSVSTDENNVSAYSTINSVADSMTIIIVNRDMAKSKNVSVNLSNFSVSDGNYTTLQLSSLPTTETFISHTNNALKLNSVSVNANSFSISVPSLSVTAVILRSSATGIKQVTSNQTLIDVFPNPVKEKLNISIESNLPEITETVISDISGRKLMALKDIITELIP